MPFLATTMAMGVSLLAIMVYRDVLRRKRDADAEKISAARFEGRLRTVKKPKPPETET